MSAATKANALTWSLLVALTAASAVVGRGQARGAIVVGLLLLAGTKVGLLAWRFMELGRAHWFWRASLVLVVGPFLAAVAFVAIR